MLKARGTCIIISLMSGLAIAPIARASFYDVEIEQVIAGVNGDTSVQAIQLRIRVDSPNNFSPIRLVVRDVEGNEPIVLFDFDPKVPHTTDSDRYGKSHALHFVACSPRFYPRQFDS